VLKISGAPKRSSAFSRAATQKSVVSVVETRQARTVREAQSMIAQRKTKPVAIGMYLMSVAHT